MKLLSSHGETVVFFSLFSPLFYFTFLLYFPSTKNSISRGVLLCLQYFQRTNRLADVNRRLKSQIWSSVVTIVLVEAKNLLPMDIDGLSDPYVKFRYEYPYSLLFCLQHRVCY